MVKPVQYHPGARYIDCALIHQTYCDRCGYIKMTDNKLSITVDDLMAKARLYKQGMITDQDMAKYIEVTMQLVTAEAELTTLKEARHGL